MTLAILKPDHIGDLVLSSAAIRCALARRPGSVLFVASSNLALARILFPAATIQAIDFPHLSKIKAGHAGYPDLRAFEHVMFLRADNRINPAWADLRCRNYSFPSDSHDHHQAMLDYGVAAALLGEYDIDSLHFGANLAAMQQKASTPPQSIGLCIGSGFHANLWPAAHWLGLGEALLAAGRDVHVIAGPAEAGLGAALTSALGLPAQRLIRGGADIAAFLDQVGTLDRVVASDGGAAHLCSLRAPMLSIFGPSPFRRYAPYGVFNRLLTRDLSCSPCCQWTSTLVNGCLSNECITSITPADVLNALRPPYHIPREGYATPLRPGLSLYEGVSHLSFRTKLAERTWQQNTEATLPAKEAKADANGPEPTNPGPNNPGPNNPGPNGWPGGGRGIPGPDIPAAPADRADADSGGARRRRRGKAAAPGA